MTHSVVTFFWPSEKSFWRLFSRVWRGQDRRHERNKLKCLRLKLFSLWSTYRIESSLLYMSIVLRFIEVLSFGWFVWGLLMSYQFFGVGTFLARHAAAIKVYTKTFDHGPSGLSSLVIFAPPPSQGGRKSYQIPWMLTGQKCRRSERCLHRSNLRELFLSFHANIVSSTESFLFLENEELWVAYFALVVHS